MLAKSISAMPVGPSWNWTRERGPSTTCRIDAAVRSVSVDPDHRLLTCPLLVNFNSLYPGITLSTFEMPQDNIETAVIEDLIDGIVFRKPSYTEVQSSEIETELFPPLLASLAVGNAHLRAGQEERRSAEEFGGEALVLLNHNFALRRHT